MDALATAALGMPQVHILSAVTGLPSGTIPGLSGLAVFGSMERVNPAAKVQGDVDFVTSVLIVLSLPVAAICFSGMLGQFAAKGSFGNVGRNSSVSRSGFETEYDAKDACCDGTSDGNRE